MEDDSTQTREPYQGPSTSTNGTVTTSYVNRNSVFVLEKLRHLRQQQHYCDLTFDLRGTKFYGHRNVVAAWSPFFYHQLNFDSVRKEMIKVHYDNHSAFASLLDFMYSGHIDLRETNLFQVLHLATSFQIEPLRELCEGTLRCNLHVGNIVRTFQVARKFKLASLEEYALTYLQMHLPDAVKQADFLNLTAIRFNSFLSSGWVVHLKPEVKLFLIISWLGFDVKDREQYFVVLLRHIDWSSVANDFLTEISQTENFFTTNESSLYLLLQTLHSSGISLGPYSDAFPALRQKYSYLLGQVVQNSVMMIISEDYFPVTTTVVHFTTSDASGDTTEQAKAHTDVPPIPQLSSENDRNYSSFSNVDIVMSEISGGSGTSGGQNQQSTGHSENSSAAAVKEKRDTGEILPKAPVVDVETAENPTTKKSGRKRGRPRKLVSGDPSPKNVGAGKKGKEKILPSKQPLTKSKTKDNPEKRGESFGVVCKIESSEQTVQACTNVGEKAVARNGSEDSSVHKMDKDFEDSDYNAESDESEEKAIMRIRRRGRPPKGSEKRRKCHECNYVAGSESRMKRHIEIVHKSGNVYRCPVCTFECKWNKNYYTHMKSHFLGPPFRCDYDGCQHTSDRIQFLLIHRLKHSDERQFGCEICGTRFRTKNNLYAHRKCHSGARPFECPECHRCFGTKNTMEQHLVTHSDHRPYLCDICGFSTKYQSHLIAHKRIHTGEVFPCQFPQCTYSTPKRSQLKAHMRSHLGIRRHVCSTCGKAFVERSHLIRHEKIHMEDKPYKCSLCEYATTRVDKLKEHVDKHHGDNSTGKLKYKPRKSRRGKDEIWPPSQVNLEHAAPLEDIPNIAIIAQGHQISCEHQYVRSIEPASSGTATSHHPPGIVHSTVIQSAPPPQTAATHHQSVVGSPVPQHQAVNNTVGQQTIIGHDRRHMLETTSHDDMSHHIQPSIVTSQPHMQVMTQQHSGAIGNGMNGLAYKTPTTCTPVSMTTSGQQQEYGGLGAFMALF